MKHHQSDLRMQSLLGEPILRAFAVTRRGALFSAFALLSHGDWHSSTPPNNGSSCTESGQGCDGTMRYAFQVARGLSGESPWLYILMRSGTPRLLLTPRSCSFRRSYHINILSPVLPQQAIIVGAA